MTPLVINAGVAGVVIILIIFKVLVPGWYARRLEKENEVLRAAAERAAAELSLTNQLVQELRTIAAARAGIPAPGGSYGGPTPVAAPPP